MEGGAIPGGRTGYEVRIGRRAVLAVHCQVYDVPQGLTVDRPSKRIVSWNRTMGR
jgi:hypothetical protein